MDESLTTYDEWCRQRHALLAEGGIWVVPRSGLEFTRRGERFVLTGMMPGYDPDEQEADLLLIQAHFASAGITVSDERIKA